MIGDGGGIGDGVAMVLGSEPDAVQTQLDTTGLGGRRTCERVSVRLR